eukprot:TRINITY_DN4554_c0_g1_i1.p1 TRINITY_DN4554_c0_g1~~TRINITY_DN4554_c0_g1_i1.p1  ORF type:complete len:74 (-),score=9.83 TRINITY_DN4554_c0_g1_i1:15-236(-)
MDFDVHVMPAKCSIFNDYGIILFPDKPVVRSIIPGSAAESNNCIKPGMFTRFRKLQLDDKDLRDKKRKSNRIA